MKKYQFKRPHWALILLTLGFLALFIVLGCWQLRRATEKENLQQLYTSRINSPAIPFSQLPKNGELRYIPIEISGTYDTAHSMLLDNKINQHRVGYEVLTPFLPTNGQRWLLINRGWIPAPAHRQLPHLDTITGLQTLTGVIYTPSKSSFTLGNLTETNAQWPLRLQNLNLDSISQILHESVYPFIVLLNPLENHGFVRDWQPVNMPAYKHLGYAVQWFTIAFVLIIIFIACHLKKNKN